MVDRFSKELAIKTCKVNDADFDPADWLGTFGGATPYLKKVAMRILSLTSSSSGFERNWSTFEGIHTKKRNRLEARKLNNLVYVQFNANLMKKTKREKIGILKCYYQMIVTWLKNGLLIAKNMMEMKFNPNHIGKRLVKL